jgi:exodeoxyribonuclease V alpha subunit
MMQPELMLRQLRGEQLIGELDLHFALFLLQSASQPSESLGLAAALTCQATAEGHVCLALPTLAGQSLFEQSAQSIDSPGVTAWRDALLQSGVVGRPGEYQPLILDSADRLYLHRYWAYEQRLGRSIRERADALVTDIDERQLSLDLDALFNASLESQIDWQKVASATALLRRLTVISGGPGTGKTSTVVRVLALLRMQPGGESLRIHLAAPTGMAASRLQRSIAAAKRSLPLSPEVSDRIPEQASTLHRLLGVKRQGTGFHHHRDNPLPADLLVVDEASMVDVALMAKLFDALAQNCRVILLGDRDQLASVEAGAVLGDLCAGCDGASGEFAERLRAISGEPIPDLSPPGGVLSNNVVSLQHSYRFAQAGAIGQLAAAVNRGDADLAIHLMQGSYAGLVWQQQENDVASLAASRYVDLFRQLEDGVLVEQLFETLQSFRLLSALRTGPSGTEHINAQITHELMQQGVISREVEWFPGRPVMVTRNDYQLQLYNGDTGIVLPQPDNPESLAAVFPAGDGEARWIPISRLPACETVFAMTVHKSQGSEFEEVVLSLPTQTSPVLCRELVYTAITRARSKFTLTGPAEIFRHAIENPLQRDTGLPEILAS